jgi:hypothetical protein
VIWALLLACDPGPARVPATAAPVPPEGTSGVPPVTACDPAAAALAPLLPSPPAPRLRPGGCSVDATAPLPAGADPEAALRAAWPGWTEDPAAAADGPTGRRFSLQAPDEDLRCLVVFEWGPEGPAAGAPWTLRVDCALRPGAGPRPR